MSVLWAPAQAKLERGFRFRALAYLQVGSDAALYGVATVLALAGLGVWSPVLGTLAASGFLLVGSYALAGYRPRLAFSRERTREFGRFGIQFVPSPLLWTLTQLVNPIVVGTMLGSASVGYVALATRLADTAGFVVRATYRIALVSLSRVQNDLPRLRRGFEEMLTLQAIGVGVPLAALAVAAPPLLPVLFGDEWRPALDVLPFVSFGLLMLAVFNTHLALLYVFGRTLATSGVALVRFALLAGTALLLVPSLELIGYGLAVLVASDLVDPRGPSASPERGLSLRIVGAVVRRAGTAAGHSPLRQSMVARPARADRCAARPRPRLPNAAPRLRGPRAPSRRRRAGARGGAGRCRPNFEKS